jgi:hypothetical protein
MPKAIAILLFTAITSLAVSFDATRATEDGASNSVRSDWIQSNSAQSDSVNQNIFKRHVHQASHDAGEHRPPTIAIVADITDSLIQSDRRALYSG